MDLQAHLSLQERTLHCDSCFSAFTGKRSCLSVCLLVVSGVLDALIQRGTHASFFIHISRMCSSEKIAFLKRVKSSSLDA